VRKTTDQLHALDEWTQLQIQSLAHDRALIQAELQARGTTNVAPLAFGANSQQGSQLEYLTPHVAMAQNPGIGDPYADNARRYGLRTALIGGAILFAACILLFIIASLP
jgi:hypothetical protein